MKNLNYIFFAFIFLLFLTSLTRVNAQKITHLKSELKENKIIITYNLTGPKKQKFLISLYASKNNDNNYDVEVTSAEGDVGYGIKPGKKKQIIWDPSLEGFNDMTKVKFSLQSMASGLAPKKK